MRNDGGSEKTGHVSTSPSCFACCSGRSGPAEPPEDGPRSQISFFSTVKQEMHVLPEPFFECVVLLDAGSGGPKNFFVGQITR